MKRIPRIILQIPTSRSYKRGILRGIARYARLKGLWAIYHPPHFYLEPKRHKDLFDQLAAFDADGIIMREQYRPEEKISLLVEWLRCLTNSSFI